MIDEWEFTNRQFMSQNKELHKRMNTVDILKQIVRDFSS